MTNKKSCAVITAYIEGQIRELIDINAYDYIICADNGYFLALQEDIQPDLVIGDFDSLSDNDLLSPLTSEADCKTDTDFHGSDFSQTAKPETLRFPTEKDYTDTHICIQEALNRGFNQICIVGGIGGRLDHTLSNLQTMAWAMNFCSSKAPKLPLQIVMIDKKNEITLIKDSELTLHGKQGEKFSLVSYSESCQGVNVQNAKWSLENAVLTNQIPIGISNEFLNSPCQISVAKGELLIIRSLD